MSSTGTLLRTAVQLLNHHGIHTGRNFVGPGGELDICAAIFRAATGKVLNCFHNDEDASLLQIQACEPAMDAIRMLSDVLDTQPPTDPATGKDDHIEHVCDWAINPHGRPAPSPSELIGRILRAAQTADTLTDPRTDRIAA